DRVVDDEAAVVDRDRVNLDVAAVDLRHGKAHLPVGGALLEVLLGRLSNVHQVPDLDSGHRADDLTTEPEGIRELPHPVGVSHDHRSLEVFRRVERRIASDSAQRDLAQVPVRGDPAWGDLVEVRQTGDAESV